MSEQNAALLRQREGPTLNKSLFALGDGVKAFAAGADSDSFDFEASMLTRCLKDVVGGNTNTVVLTTIRSGDFETNAFILTFAQVWFDPS